MDGAPPRKVASIGISFSRGITAHGFALYVEPQALDGFSLLVPCATPGLRLTTVSSERRAAMTVAELAPVVGRALQAALADAAPW
jgi:lipoate-protein ligase B